MIVLRNLEHPRETGLIAGFRQTEFRHRVFSFLQAVQALRIWPLIS